MRVLRQVIGCAVGCLVGVVLPVAATIYDGLYRHHRREQDPAWPSNLISNMVFTALGSAIVGLIVGALGVGLLHATRRCKVGDYLAAGVGIGAASGAFFTAATQIPGDSAVGWAIFITLPALSMALGFGCYWFICVRSHAS